MWKIWKPISTDSVAIRSLSARDTLFLIQAAFVGLGELVVCYAAGMPLCAAINKTGLRKYLK